MAETNKVVTIRITYADGKVMGADSDDAETIWRSICNDVALTAIRAGVAYKYTGPSLQEIKGEGASAASLSSAEELARKIYERAFNGPGTCPWDKLPALTQGHYEIEAKEALAALAALSSDKVSKEVNSHENRR